ncbi:aldehyde dehydrogenase family protein [Methanolinea mesophila]|uniref:aldehyde dehydrogenase family protein n=1 Tax=Methanolinea mesophila TaxID=547055 RepID=UPI001AE7D592|nr:aldehyde dehydrogenase family protein [Methanolinea mesophila]
METRKKLTYVDLLADESIHVNYEEALQEVGPELGRSHPMFIGGKEVFGTPEFEVRSPFDTRILVGKFPLGTVMQVNAAIESAKEGFDSWSTRPWTERAGIIRKTADILDGRRFWIAALITMESGKNRYEAIAEISEGIDMLRYYAGVYEKNQGYEREMAPESPAAECRSVMRPHGVWAVISPFNFPIALIAGMAGGTLLTGNTAVLKPTSTAPCSALELYRAFIGAGIPKNAVHYVTGPGKMFGDAVVGNPDIAGIAFTGSRDVGLWLQRSFLERQPWPKPVVSEMGSKNPVIVTAKADLERAVEGVVKAAFGYSGQKCSATSRVYVQEPVAEQFIAALKKKAESLQVGDPKEKETFVGPVIEKKAFDRFLESVAEARHAGAQVLAGGETLDDGIFAHGYYVRPTLVTGLPRDHPLVKRELFLPFLIVDTFSTLEEALRLANDTEYGLTAGIFSKDPGEVAYFFDRIRFGVTYANRSGGATTGAWPGSQPFGGWKASGSTGKGVGGPYYLLSFLREQARTVIRE